MGFSEDDRIRGKNKLHNEAYDAFEWLIKQDLSPAAIIDALEIAIHNDPDEIRNDKRKAVINIARGALREKDSGSTSSTLNEDS
jgi:hypothetical protein